MSWIDVLPACAPLVSLLLPAGPFAALAAAPWLGWCAAVAVRRGSGWACRPDWSPTAPGGAVAR